MAMMGRRIATAFSSARYWALQQQVTKIQHNSSSWTCGSSTVLFNEVRGMAEAAFAPPAVAAAPTAQIRSDRYQRSRRMDSEKGHKRPFTVEPFLLSAREHPGSVKSVYQLRDLQFIPRAVMSQSLPEVVAAVSDILHQTKFDQAGEVTAEPGPKIDATDSEGERIDARKIPATLEHVPALLYNFSRGTPTLVGTAVSNDQHGFIRVPLVNSRLVLPDLRVTDSSEAMLSGRKPPLRMMMRAVYKDTLLPVPHMRHAISEGFVVATRRTRTAGKVEIPSVDDHVSKLEHMGRETVKKLSDVTEAAQQAGIDDLRVPSMGGKRLCIETVGAFQQLAMAAEHDPQLQKRLQQVLKLNKEKWEEARDHAMKAVVVDNRMRVWWASSNQPSSSRVGIVFSCTKGTLDLETPIALIQEGGKLLFSSDWSPAQLDFVRQLQPMALSQWWQPNHTNWDLLQWDSEIYKNTGQLVASNVDTNTASVGPPGGDMGGQSNPYSDVAAAANALHGGLGPSRLVSGMSIEGFLPEPLVASRNASGLDTMQSIEHALPDGESQQAA